MKNIYRYFVIFFILLILKSCATAPNNLSEVNDPYEKYNRSMFEFNKKLDENIIRPTAEFYDENIPYQIKNSVTNFFENISDIKNGANNILQGKINNGISDLTRFVFNSTFGILGFIDISSEFGIPKSNEDFGQTLGVWGFKSGPYVVLPIFGPSTLRDSFAMPINIYSDPINLSDSLSTFEKNISRTLKIVDKRATFLEESSMLEQIALDPYLFFRDAYLQRRESQVKK
tara:strand:- start:10 stop:699 length:690 start_codon:yes stop_codon:yes gene_type:complete